MMAHGPYRVLIVEDNKIVRQALHSLLDQPGEFVVSDEADGDGAIARATQLHPEVVLLDLNLPNVERGIQTLSELHASAPDTRIVTLIDTDADTDLVYRLIHNGAVGCLLKRDSGIDEVKEAVRKVAAGQVFFSSSALVSLVHAISTSHQSHPSTATGHPDDLTEREYEVLELVAGGHSNRAIANRLVISESTVRSHLQHIFDKLQLENRVQVAAFALRSGRLVAGSLG